MIDVRIYVNNTQHGVRNWPAVPRIGDDVAVQVDGTAFIVRVERVVWGQQSIADFGDGTCQVLIYTTNPLPLPAEEIEGVGI